MAQRIGSGVIAQMLFLSILVLHSDMAYAVNYRVGGYGGWTFDIVNWPNGKHFNAGDILVFNYVYTTHNVAVVNKAGYDTCSAPSGSLVYRSGHDRIQLAPGWNYFICNFPSHCEAGMMKIAVNAT